MKKSVLIGTLLFILFVFAGCGNSHSFELKVSNVIIRNNEAFVQGDVLKGTISNGDMVKVVRDGKEVKSFKVLDLSYKNKNGSQVGAKTISKKDNYENVGLGFEDVGVNDIGKGDIIAK